MSSFPWFPIGHKLPDGSVGRLQQEGAGYQIIQNQTHGSVFLVLENACLAAKGAEKLFDPSGEGFHSIEFGDRSYRLRLFEKNEQPVIVRDWSTATGLPTSADVFVLGKAIRSLRGEFPKADVGSSLFIPTLGACLPIGEISGGQDLRSLAVGLLAAGAQVQLHDVTSMRSINSWLTPDEIQTFLAAFGVDITEPEAPRRAVDPNSFTLPGRPELETFFREYILEPSADHERYASLGVKMPNGVLLYGPTGSGKESRGG